MSGTPNEILATIWRSMTILTGTIYIIVLWHITTNKTGQKYQYKNNIQNKRKKLCWFQKNKHITERWENLKRIKLGHRSFKRNIMLEKCGRPNLNE